MQVLNVKPQSTDVGASKPPQRREVILQDHHQTWLANFNEIRDEVNQATSYSIPRTLVYRNEYGSFGANTIAANQLIFGNSDPTADPEDSPIIMNADGLTLGPSTTLNVKGPAKFSNTVHLDANSEFNLDGPLNSNSVANFRDVTNFYAFTHFHPSSVLFVDTTSIFNDSVSINAPLGVEGPVTIVGDINQTGNNTIDGSVDIEDDLIIRGNLTVLGEKTQLEVTELVVEDKNIVVNKNDVYTPLDAGLFIQKGTIENAGYFKVHSSDDSLLQLKAPTGFDITIDIPSQDVKFRLESDFAADQELLTTSNVAFRSLVLDKTFSRHNLVPSYTQNHDAIAAGKGWISTPWVYTNAVESSDNLIDANTTGLFMGTTTHTMRNEISFLSNGNTKFHIDYFGNIGMGTLNPLSDLHLASINPEITITTEDYKSNATLSFTDFAERVDDSGMYLAFDANTGSGILELTTQDYQTKFDISVGGYNKTPEVTISNDKVSFFTDVDVLGNGYVDKELIVDSTLYVRSNKVGVNVVTPAYAFDVSGSIRGNSDLILDGLEPFIKVGTVTSLEPNGRSGLVVQEESPVVQLSTTEDEYRHGSILYFNDSYHDSNWVIGTSLNGNKLDFGKSFSKSANTPEYGLDEYHGQTLLRFTEEDRSEFYLEADNSNAALILNTRTNGIHLYLGEENNVLGPTIPRPTTTYTSNDFSSVIQWHGSEVTVGELTYFPNGNDDGEFGSFRFSRTDGQVNQDVPSAKVGANQFYANDKIAVSQTTPTAELHITKDYSEALIETEDAQTFIKMFVNDSTETVNMRGENSSGAATSYFAFNASNPASLDFTSGDHSLTGSSDHSTQIITLSLSETRNPSNFKLQTESNKNFIDITRTSSNLNYSLDVIDQDNVITDSKSSTTLEMKSELNEALKSIQYNYYSSTNNLIKSFYLDDINQTISELNASNNLDYSTILDEPNKKLTYHSNVYTVFNKHTLTDVDIEYRSQIANDKHYTLELGAAESNLNLSRDNSDFNLKIFNDDTKLTLENNKGIDAYGTIDTPTQLELDLDSTGNSYMMFSGYRFTFKHETHPLFNAYHDYVDFISPVNFYNDVLIEGALTANSGITFPTSNPNNKIEFNLTDLEGEEDDDRTSITNYIKWTCNTDAAQIYFASTDDTSTKFWGDSQETVDTSRLIFQSEDNENEGFEFKHVSSTGNGVKEILLLDRQHAYVNVPILQTHEGRLIEYQSNNNKWLLAEENTDTGLYFNVDSTALSFTNNLSEYTNAENINNQYVFVKEGTPKASIDLDTGSIRTAGDLVADNDVIGFVTSDKNYKENIMNMTNALDKIDLIRGVEFDWKENPSGYNGHDVGVIAQEIEEVIPEAVRVGANGQKQVNYDRIIPLLIECIKELKSKL